MKKLLLSLGALAAIVAPVASVVACGSNDSKTDALSQLKTQYKDQINKYADDSDKAGLLAKVDALKTQDDATKFAQSPEMMAIMTKAATSALGGTTGTPTTDTTGTPTTDTTGVAGAGQTTDTSQSKLDAEQVRINGLQSDELLTTAKEADATLVTTDTPLDEATATTFGLTLDADADFTYTYTATATGITIKATLTAANTLTSATAPTEIAVTYPAVATVDPADQKIVDDAQKALDQFNTALTNDFNRAKFVKEGVVDFVYDTQESKVPTGTDDADLQPVYLSMAFGEGDKGAGLDKNVVELHIDADATTHKWTITVCLKSNPNIKAANPAEYDWTAY